MPELHKNQIKWEAPEPRKVDFDKPNYTPLADALGNLGETADAVSRTIAAYQDNKLAKNLEAANARANKAFEEADVLNANYDEVADNAIADWQSQFDGLDDYTKERFFRKNPNAAEEFEILVRSKAFEKRNNQIYNHSKLDIAQWSTEVVNAGWNIKDPKKRAELQNQIKQDKVAAIQNLGLPIEMTDDLLFKFQSELDDYSIAYAIANNNFSEARRLLKEDLPTKGASQRAMLWKQLQGEEERYAKEKALEAAALEEAKEKGTDKASKLILELHQSLLASNNIEAADKLRRDYYAGKDILIPGEDGRPLAIVHSSDVSPTGRDKLYASMLTSANRAPAREEYRAQYLADFNRLASGLMQTDGSLELDDDEYVTPEQYALALKLKESNAGWDMLEKNQQVFLDNVLRSYGTDEGLYMIDLNPRTQMRGESTLGAHYQKANPVVNYQALLGFYSNPANVIVSALSDDTQLTGREFDTVSHFADKYKKEKFKGDYEIKKGTRADALVNMFTLVATNNNPYGMKDVGLDKVPRKYLESKMVQYITNIKNKGYYEQPADYATLVNDFKALYEATTGYKYTPPKDSNPLQKYAVLAVSASKSEQTDNEARLKYKDQLPRDDTWYARNRNKDLGLYWTETEFNESLYPTGEGAVRQLDRQRAKQLDKLQVSTYQPRGAYIRKTEEEREVERKGKTKEESKKKKSKEEEINDVFRLAGEI